jgi:hypothetical protein
VFHFALDNQTHATTSLTTWQNDGTINLNSGALN